MPHSLEQGPSVKQAKQDPESRGTPSDCRNPTHLALAALLPLAGAGGGATGAGGGGGGGGACASSQLSRLCTDLASCCAPSFARCTRVKSGFLSTPPSRRNASLYPPLRTGLAAQHPLPSAYAGESARIRPAGEHSRMHASELLSVTCGHYSLLYAPHAPHSISSKYARDVMAWS